MERRDFGNSGFQAPAIGQGSWQIERAREREAVAALQLGLDLGMTHIDTAEMYGAGAAERIVGKAIRGRRDEVFLVSKVLPSNASAEGTIAACERTLRNLGTDRLDCYLLHWRGNIPLAETLDAFMRLEREGRIRSWGVSNFDVDDLEETLALAGTAPACNQVLYHPWQRAVEHAVLPWCAAHGTALVAYTPFGGNAAAYEPVSRGGRALQRIAAAHAATARQVALRFLLRHPAVLVIPKAAQAAHVRENAGAMAFTLDAGEVLQLDTALPRGPRPRELPTD
jgi:diketogulonate reductase-like aldo/keto reductase